MIQTQQIWTKQKSGDPNRLDVYVTTEGVFDEKQDKPESYEFRGTGYRELAKAIFSEKADMNVGEKQYTHLVGRIEGKGKDAVLVLNPKGASIGLIRGSEVAGSIVKGWNPSQSDSTT